MAAHLERDVILRTLVSMEHDLHAVDTNAATTLHYAAQGNSKACSEFLITAGVKVNSRDV
jgi:hypothetical protein